ncbi:DUF6350 family protein [Brevibacterium sp. NPDC049920]|uniref:cell division protein PerM n=1 Tax=Brevibacterium TaxID=1696 RepID=UPI001586F83D|nr:DUF6350 family protein [uncultured Brevibacterium sp.]
MKGPADSGRAPGMIGRHPAVIGLFESARVLLLLVLTALLLAAVAWFIGIAEQRPLAAIAAWAATGLGVVHGLNADLETHRHSLPPTSLTLLVWLLVLQAARRTRRALHANERLAAAGAPLVLTRPRLIAGSVLAGTHLLLVLVLAFGFGAIGASVLGFARIIVLVGSAVLLGFGWRPDAEPVRARVRDLAGPHWAEALAAGHAVFRRAGLAALVVGLLALGAALALRWEQAASVLALYSDATAAAVGLTAVQLLFAPTLVVLGLAWTSGAGVVLASGALASPFTAVEVPVAGFPVLAAVPQDPAGAFVLVPLAVVLCGIVAVIGRPAWHLVDLRAVAVIGIEMLLAGLFVGLFASGAVGPGGLAGFGLQPVLFALAVAGEIALGAAIGWGLVRLAGRGRAAD